ncbi:MAG: hypothetical protein BGO55_16190 [Sphingobacteriales bacterium 50-39]|nr:MAG: hypothetical protein BGO55_16190 [Sphingobacteriales bacterium 50-39]
MKNKKFILGALTLVLAVAGLLATKANRKFAGGSTAFFKTNALSSTFHTLFIGVSASDTRVNTLSSGGSAVSFKTAGMSSAQPLYADKSTSHPLYYH